MRRGSFCFLCITSVILGSKARNDLPRYLQLCRTWGLEAIASSARFVRFSMLSLKLVVTVLGVYADVP